MNTGSSFFRIDLAVCILATVLWSAVTIYYTVSISKAKKKLLESDKAVPRSEKQLIPTVICTFILLSLPYLIYFKAYITAVLEGCAVLGAFNVLKERLSELKKALES